MTIGELIVAAEQKGYALHSLFYKSNGEWQARFFKGGVGNVVGVGRTNQAAVEDAVKQVVDQLELPFEQ